MLHVILYLRIDYRIAAIESLKVKLFFGHFIIECLALSRVEIVCHSLRPSTYRTTSPMAASSILYAFPQFFESRRRIQEISELGHHVAREDAKDVSLVLRKLCEEVSKGQTSSDLP